MKKSDSILVVGLGVLGVIALAAGSSKASTRSRGDGKKETLGVRNAKLIHPFGKAVLQAYGADNPEIEHIANESARQTLDAPAGAAHATGAEAARFGGNASNVVKSATRILRF